MEEMSAECNHNFTWENTALIELDGHDVKLATSDRAHLVLFCAAQAVLSQRSCRRANEWPVAAGTEDTLSEWWSTVRYSGGGAVA